MIWGKPPQKGAFDARAPKTCRERQVVSSKIGLQVGCEWQTANQCERRKSRSSCSSPETQRVVGCKVSFRNWRFVLLFRASCLCLRSRSRRHYCETCSIDAIKAGFMSCEQAKSYQENQYFLRRSLTSSAREFNSPRKGNTFCARLKFERCFFASSFRLFVSL